MIEFTDSETLVLAILTVTNGVGVIAVLWGLAAWDWLKERRANRGQGK